MRVIFMGTPDFAVGTLMQIVGNGHELAAVYTQPPRPAQRGMGIKKTPVHAVAEAFRVPVLTPESLKERPEQTQFKDFKADIAVVVAYGQILPKILLNAPRKGCLNLHASLLPRWRGAAPIQRAIMAGDTETGVAVMRMEEGLDTGPVGMQEKMPIEPYMTAGDLHDRLSVLGADLMVEALAHMEDKALRFFKQDEENVTYAKKISKTETRIRWTRNAENVHNHIRGISPFPGAWCEFSVGGHLERLKVLRTKRMDGSGGPGELLDDEFTVACGTGAIRIEQVQRAGKNPMSGVEFLRGVDLTKGSILQ